MKRLSWISVLTLALCSLNAAVQAQTPSAAEATQVVNLSASAQQEVPQDWLTVVVRASVEGQDPTVVQNQLKALVEQAMVPLRAQVKPQALEVRSGSFGVYPRHSDKGRLMGWQGQADVLIEGRDFAKVSQAAAQVPRMTVAQTGFSLSRQARQQLEADVQSQAVQKFRQRAQQLAKDFGFTTYSLRQVSVGSVDRPSGMPAPMMARAAMADAPPSPIPLEGGKEEVQITVSGSIQLR